MKDAFIRDLKNPTVADYLAQVTTAGWSDHTIYRGHQKQKWKVTPVLLRNPCDSDKKLQGIPATLREHRMFDEFCRHLPAFRPDLVQASRGPNASASEWRIMALARHYGLPTRFIDFTTNPLVALFFAVEQEPGEDAIVWLVRVESRRNTSEVGKIVVEGKHKDIETVAWLQKRMSTGDSPMAGKEPFGKLRTSKARQDSSSPSFSAIRC